jgi:hypothetical protein
MKRTTRIVAMLLAVLVTSVPPAPAQERPRESRANPAAEKSARKQSFAPRIRGRSESFIVEGSIIASSSGAIRVRTDAGQRATFEVDDQTTVLQAGELVSISTLADIELDPSDLQIFDRVEIIFEREGGRRLARIITRVESESDRVAKR